MKKYVCSVCGFIYDEAAGLPDQGIVPGTKWEDLPANWVCPLCGAAKNDFIGQDTGVQFNKQPGQPAVNEPDKTNELSFAEMSALCSNLSKGCQKQYLTEEADLFNQLSEYYKNKTAPAEENNFEILSAMIQQDLESGYAQAKTAAAAESDRGAMRALTWGEKATKLLSSLLRRYQTDKDGMTANPNIYVCEICGYVYIGNEPPAICPICKVPNMKIVKVERR